MTAAEPPAYPLRPLALVSWSPEDFRRERAISFRRGADDLDEYDWAWLDIADTPMFLLRYVHSPEPGTQLLSAIEADPKRTIDTFLSAVGLPDNVVEWTTDERAVMQPVLVEPANPFDIPRERLEDFVQKLRDVIAVPAPRLHLRPEVGFGVQAFQAVRVWLPKDFDDTRLPDVLELANQWLKELWESEVVEQPPKRTRSLVVYRQDGTPQVAVRVDGTSGQVLIDDAPDDEYPLPPPIFTDPPE